uniref:Uncharacterized protein n=1 Tax=Solanum tuberosum TaxID=4113 RepID=M1BR06_SOLTU
MKIEKVNCCEVISTYWMTVKVSNLTLGSIETFQIHAGMHWVTNDKIIFCCRPKEEGSVLKVITVVAKAWICLFS